MAENIIKADERVVSVKGTGDYACFTRSSGCLIHA